MNGEGLARRPRSTMVRVVSSAAALLLAAAPGCPRNGGAGPSGTGADAAAGAVAGAPNGAVPRASADLERRLLAVLDEFPELRPAEGPAAPADDAWPLLCEALEGFDEEGPLFEVEQAVFDGEPPPDENLVAAWLKKNESAFALVDEVLARGRCRVPEEPREEWSGRLRKLLWLWRGWRVRAVRDFGAGRYAEAAGGFLDQLRFGELLAGAGPLGVWILGGGAQEISCGNFRRLAGRPVPEADLQRIVEALAFREAFADQAAAGLAGELRALVRELARRAGDDFAGEADLAKLVRILAGEGVRACGNLRRKSPDWAACPEAQVRSRLAECQGWLNEVMAKALSEMAAGRRPDPEEIVGGVPAPAPDLQTLTAQATRGLDGAARRYFHVQAQRAGTRCVLALALYERRHGLLPETLDDLVADGILADVPRDPALDVPLLYDKAERKVSLAGDSPPPWTYPWEWAVPAPAGAP